MSTSSRFVTQFYPRSTFLNIERKSRNDTWLANRLFFYTFPLALALLHFRCDIKQCYRQFN